MIEQNIDEIFTICFPYFYFIAAIKKDMLFVKGGHIIHVYDRASVTLIKVF